MSQTPAPVPQPPAPRKRRFGCLPIFLSLLTLVLLAAAFVIWMARSEPAKWREVNRIIADATPEEIGARAESLEKRLFNESQGIDAKTGPVVKPNVDLNAPVERTITISVADANMWLASRLESTLANQKASLPKAIENPRVWIEDEQVVLSAKVTLPAADIDGVVSFSLDAKMQDDGQITMKIDKVHAGKLRLPAGVVADQIQQELKTASADAVQMVGKAFDGMTFDPVFEDPGDKTRQTRVLNFKIHEDRVDLTLRNEKKGTSAKKP